MRIICWNVRRATKSSSVWGILNELNPDIALLQEVSSFPKDISKSFDIKFHKAVGKNGKTQRFGTAILVKGRIISELELTSEYEWVNHELKYFAGNLVSCIAIPQGRQKLNIVSVYSPAWSVDPNRLKGIDVTQVRLKNNPKIWVTELLWAALKNVDLTNDKGWIVGGDLNSSETFASPYPRGNREILDRMSTIQG